MKKIVILYDFLKEMGGLERVMFFQANSLRKKFKIILIFGYVSEKDKGEIINNLELNKNIEIEQLGFGRNEIAQLVTTFLFPKRISRIETDMIISHSFMTHQMGHIKNKLNGTPYIAFLHHPPNFLYSRNIKWANNIPRLLGYCGGLFLGPFLKKLDTKAVRNASLVLVNSHYTNKRIKKIYGISSLVVYPPVSSDFKIIKKEIVQKNLRKLKVPNEFIFLHGRIIKDKRPDLAIKAFSKINNSFLVISGTIEEKRKIKNLIKTLNISDRVKILGKVSKDELVSLYNGASCFLMSAPKEDFGLTPVEAMACGCPVVAWRDGAGPNETIVEKINGFLAKPYDVDDFSKKITICLKKKWKKKDISNSINKFSNENIIKRFNLIVEKLI